MNVTNVMNMCVFFSLAGTYTYTHNKNKHIPLNMRIIEQEIEKKEEPKLTREKKKLEERESAQKCTSKRRKNRKFAMEFFS